MNSQVAQLEPKTVWSNFERLNEVPRPSKKEQRVIEFMAAFGKQLGWPTEVDEVGNVKITKPAAKGYENRIPVVLQSHLDMVHQKNSDTVFDFEQQGIQAYVDDGWVRARGTTLGADNGIGVAAIMAILQDRSMAHGPLEALLTIDEETGMTGAANLRPNWLQGRILLNLDTEEHGDLCIGCAGGQDTSATMTYTPVAPGGEAGLELSIRGLRGGHSGCDIHLGRGNSNKLLNRLLYAASLECSAEIASIEGGNLRNAIPRESGARLAVAKADAGQCRERLNELAGQIRAEYARIEPDLQIVVSDAAAPAQVIPRDAQLRWVRAIAAVPNGVFRMSPEIAGLVETSTSLARVKVGGGSAQVEFLTRSSIESGKAELGAAITAAFELAGCQVKMGGGYPGWKPNPDSGILRLMQQVFEEQFGSKPAVNAVHAGLECGIIGSRYPEMDMISFGPTIRNPHSPDERCEIDSVQKFWQFLGETLKRIPAGG